MKNKIKNSSFENKYLFIIIFVLIIFVTFLGYWQFSNHHSRQAFIRTGYLIDKYNYTKKLRETLDNNLKSTQQNIDTLIADYHNSVDRYSIDSSHMNIEEKTEKEVIIKKQKENIERYKDFIQKKFDEDEKMILSKVLEKINN